ERGSRPIGATGTGDGASSLLQGVVPLRPAQLERRRNSEYEPRGNRDERRESNDSPIESNLVDARQRTRRDREQKISAPRRQQQAGDASHQCEHDALREHLPQNRRPARSDRGANRYLLGAQRRASE